MLFNGSIEVPFLRCSGWQRRNQKYVNVSTVRMMRKLVNGDEVKSVIVSTVVEEESRKVWNICARREKVLRTSDEMATKNEVQDKTIFTCSCHAQWSENGLGDSKCWHVDKLKSNSKHLRKTGIMLECGFDEADRTYFGDMVKLYELEREGRIVVDVMNGEGIGIQSEELMNNGVLCSVKLEDVRREGLLRKGNRVAKKWSAWCAVDFLDKMIVTGTWRRVISGIEATRVTCMNCRGEQTRKFQHEIACDCECNVDLDLHDDDGEMGDGNGDGESEESGEEGPFPDVDSSAEQESRTEEEHCYLSSTIHLHWKGGEQQKAHLILR